VPSLTSCPQVFGNSNSLPISLVISLSQTLKGLHWDKIPGDNDDEVAARGILYLMIFQQLGQLVRWSWGYHVLLAPKDKYEEYNEEVTEEGRRRNEEEVQGLIEGVDSNQEFTDGAFDRNGPGSEDSALYEPAGRTPVIGASQASPYDSEDEGHTNGRAKKHLKSRNGNGNGLHSPVTDLEDDITTFPRIRNADEPDIPDGIRGLPVRIKIYLYNRLQATKGWLSTKTSQLFDALPGPLQTGLTWLQRYVYKVSAFLWDFMNPPLWAMLIAVIVSSFPKLQRLFFEEGSFIKNSVTSAVTQSAGVAVPLILVVLGANLARNTQKREGRDPEEAEIGKKLLIASLICRMLLPTIIMAPILALFAKYVPISILDDPIFVIVAFLLTGAPSALQLAQICQINNVYETVMSKILFQSYVIWLVHLDLVCSSISLTDFARILPSTLVLVMTALEVVEWANAP
jgi:auxin efflux carrier family protein